MRHFAICTIQLRELHNGFINNSIFQLFSKRGVYAEVRSEMKRRLEKWMAITGDFYPDAPEHLVSKNGSYAS